MPFKRDKPSKVTTPAPRPPVGFAKIPKDASIHQPAPMLVTAKRKPRDRSQPDFPPGH